MQLWPIDIALPEQGELALTIYNNPYVLQRNYATALHYGRGSCTPNQLIGISKSANLVRFVPTLGERSLLVFPTQRLICPARSRLQCVIQLPLHLRMSIGTKTQRAVVDTLTPPNIAKALYGPVSSGDICTSIRVETAVTIEELRKILNTKNGFEAAPDSDVEDSENHQTHSTYGNYLFRFPGETSAVTHERRELDETNESSLSVVQELVAYATLDIHNVTDELLEVSKVMIPVTNISLFQNERYLFANTIRMKLISKQEAELNFGDCMEPGAQALDLQPSEAQADKKALIFSYSLRNKTGLEHGF